jgi:hypothetical protein
MPLVTLPNDDWLDIGYHVTEPLDEQSANGAKAMRWIDENENNTKPLPKKYAKSLRRALQTALKNETARGWHSHYKDELESLNNHYPTK